MAKKTINPKELRFGILSYKLGRCWSTALIAIAIRQDLTSKWKKYITDKRVCCARFIKTSDQFGQ